jgi:undecaprenyl-diphosphatase
VGLVFPGETAVILGGALAGQGEISIVIMLAVVWAAAWGGDSVSFLIGIKLGRGFVLRHGPRVRITRERFTRVEDYFDRHGGKTILIGRFIGLVRALAPFIAGSSGMRYRAFLPYSILGTGLWAGTFVLLGYAISTSINEATELASRGTFVFGTVVVTIVAAVLAVRFMREHENRARLARWMDARPPLRPVVALGRRIEPHARFVWHRLTPGGLGLEFTSVVAALSVALFVLIGYAVIVSGDPAPTAGDSEALELAKRMQARWLTEIAEFVVELGSTPATLAVALVAAAGLAARRRYTEVAVLVAAVAILHLAVPLIADAVERPRPPGTLVSESGSGFPSTDAGFSVIYPWLALILTVRLRPGMGNASVLITSGIAVAAVIGLSGVYLRAHYLSDASAGWGLGVSAFAISAAIAMLIAHMGDMRQNESS